MLRCVLVLLLFSSSFATQILFAQSQPVLEICIAQSKPAEGLREMQVEGQPSIYVDTSSVIGEGDIESVEVKGSDSSGKAIFLRLTRDGGKKLAEATSANLGQPMAIIFKDKVVSAPLIRSEISRNVVINGRFSESQLDAMVAALRPRPRVPTFEAGHFDALSERLDKAFDNRIFSGTVLIAVDGKVVFEKSVGYSNSKDKTPFAENASFRLASLSKQFTAMGIMMLKEQGKLDFDDDIRKHLPSLPYKGVTIRHLLHHTGGLPDYISVFAEHWDKAADGENKTAFNKDMVKLFSELKPARDFAPGKMYDYSNTGYVLLGSVIEAASGQGIHDFFRNRIFEPLKMSDSAAFSPDESIFKPDHRVFGFQWSDKESFIEVDWNFLNGMVGDGGIYASARDLLKWDQALYGEKLVSQATLDEAFTPGKLNDGEETDYGFGWLVDRSKDKGLVVLHGGNWVGFRTLIERQVERKLTIIILSNNSTEHIDSVQRVVGKLVE